MGWQHYFDDAAERLAEVGLPKPLLRTLLFESGLTIGSRVLVVGASEPRLARLLDGLGIDVTLLEDDPVVARAASGEHPEIEVHLTPDGGPLPLSATSFDAVVVRDDDAYAAGFETRRALLRTAEYAALLRPRGELSFLLIDDADGELAHEVESHLDQLPGDVACRRFESGWFRRAGKPSATLATLRIPIEPIEREAWAMLAEVAMEARGLPAAPTLEQHRPAA